jgi:hypothetical protein
MEPATFLGMLGLGYWMSKDATKEGFENTSTPNARDGSTYQRGMNPAAADRTPAGAPTVPGLPRTANFSASGIYDIQQPLPSLTSFDREPYMSPNQGGELHFPISSAAMPAQFTTQSASLLQMRPDRWEDATDRPAFVSPLTGIEYKQGEFKHANMVPFFRGQLKQNSIDNANNQVLDAYTGSGKTMFAKREITPMFEPTKEPMDVPFGTEIATDFLQSRFVEPKNRGGERPVEPIRVGPGLDDGFTQLPSGGYQQQAGEEFLIRRMARTDDLRTANNPKVSFLTPVVPGAAVVTAPTAPEDIGEVRRYNPDKFYINKGGERNFVTVGADQKAAVRSVQVVKNTTRPDTTKPYEGIAGQAEGKATYTIGSTRTPLAKQMGSWGFRNADLTNNFNPDTDAQENDYGKSGVEIRPNERFYTGERVMGLNVKPDEREVTLPQQDFVRPTRAEETIDLNRVGIIQPGGGAQPKLTVYDPNDVARTTIRETTEDSDYIGIQGMGNHAQKLTVYDPNDVARTTVRETTEDFGYYGIESPAGTAQKLTVYDPDDVMRVTGRNTLDDWDWFRNLGSVYSAEKDQTNARAMRQYKQKETVAAGRTPQGSSVKLFNGEDNIHLTYRKLTADSVNDRSQITDRVAGLPSSKEVLGVQRPRSVLKLDVSAVRNEPIYVQSLETNPYVIPLHKAALVGGKNAI